MQTCLKGFGLFPRELKHKKSHIFNWSSAGTRQTQTDGARYHVANDSNGLRNLEVRRRQAGSTSFIAVLLSHHSCNRLPPLPTKRGRQQGSIPVLTEVMLWSRHRQATNHSETMHRPPPGGLTEHQSNKALLAMHSSALSSCVCVCFFNLYKTSKSHNVSLILLDALIARGYSCQLRQGIDRLKKRVPGPFFSSSRYVGHTNKCFN